MKVGFSFNALHTRNTTDGKHRFLMRLAKQMDKDGIVIDNKKPDVLIRLPEEKNNRRAKLNIIRVDGLIMNTRWKYKSKNQRIVDSINQSDGIVYQSKFCYDSYRKFLNIKNKPFEIIPNGVSPTEFLPRSPKNFFLANCKWRPHKRLKAIFKSFRAALKEGIDADLIVTGAPEKIYDYKRIKYVGWQTSNQLKELLAGAIASIHLTWLDWCPNAMVEAIVAGVPVIYTKSGGHNDIGPGSGIGINDKQWNWKPIDLYDPPLLDYKEVANAMLELKNNKTSYNFRSDLTIETVAKNYIDYFTKLLRGR